MSNLFGLDDSDGNEDWGHDLEKESEFQGNPDSNNVSTNDNTVSTPSNQQEEAQTENRFGKFLDGVDSIDTDITNDMTEVLEDISGEMQQEYRSSLNGDNEAKKEEDPEPEYIQQDLPTDSAMLIELLQKELVRPSPNIPFLRRLLKRNHYSIPSDLRCRTYSVLLAIDSSLVTNLAESSWPTDVLNTDIIQDYVHHIYPRFDTNVENETSVVENVLWVVQGIIATTGVMYNCFFAEIALLLMCKMNMNREYTLLTILNMFETEVFTSTPTSNVNQKSNTLPSSLLIDPEKDVILTQQTDVTREARLPLFSLSRGKSAMKLHSFFHILMQFHLPALCEHLDGVYDSWWKPYSYPIEKQDDYVTNTVPGRDPYKEEEKEGFIPTAWLLSGFMNPDIVNETDAWSSLITEQLLDRLVIEGNCSFTLFFLMGLLNRKMTELMSIETKEELFDSLLMVPWGVIECDIPTIMSYACSFQETTPLSVIYGLCGVLSQCSPGLLPPEVNGGMSIWIERMTELYNCFNPSKKNRVESLLEQWKGKEDIFEKACLKNYGVDRALSRTVYYPSFVSLASRPSLDNETVLHLGAADLLHSLYSGKPSTCFCIDLRNEKEMCSGTIPSELNVEATAWKKELLLEGVLKCLNEMKGTMTMVVMSSGHPDTYSEDGEGIKQCIRVLRKNGFPRVSVVDGGFFAVHEYIRRLNKLEWLVDHSRETCEVCQYYLLSDTIQRAWEKSSELASKTTAKAKEEFAKAKSGFQKQLQKRKEKEMKSNGFFSKALQWTKELAQDISQELEKTQEMENKEQEAQTDVPQETTTEVSENIPTETPEKPKQVVIEEEEDLSLDDLSIDNIVSLNDLKSIENLTVYQLNEVVTSKGLDGKDDCYICCGGTRLILAKMLSSSQCKIVDTRDLSSLSKMTKKKGDPNTLTLTFDSESGDLMLWKFSLDDSLKLCNDVTMILSTLNLFVCLQNSDIL